MTSAPTAPPKERAGYVRIANLVDRHPLQQDVRRLKQAEKRLESLAGHLPSNNIEDSASLSGYVLSALDAEPLRPGGSNAGSSAARQTRRNSARDEFSASVASALARYSTERERRHTLLTDQRRSEMLAVGERDDADNVRKARDAEDDKVRTSIEGFIGRVVSVQLRIAVLDAQLINPPVDVFAAAPSKVERENQVEELKRYESLKAAEALKPAAQRLVVAAPVGIPMMVRLSVARVAQSAQLEKLQSELDAIKREGTGASDEAVARIQRERLDEIERKLADLSDAVKLQALLESENRAMQEVLNSEQRVASRFAENETSLTGTFSTSGKASLPIIFGVLSAQLGRVDIEKAVERIRLQQTRLERYIRLDVETTVNDVARTRNIDVLSIVPEAKTPPKTNGRTDMTSQFEKWILQPGQEAAARSTAVSSAKNVESRSGG